MPTCRSCGADIIWAKTRASGKLIPLDPLPVMGGNVRFVGDRVEVVGVGTPNPDQETRYMSHFATCPSAAVHRKKR